MSNLKPKKIQSKIDRGISFVVYGPPGAGKTTLASSLPVGETLFIQIEAGDGPLLGTGHYVFPLKEDLSQLESLYQTLRADKVWKHIVVDNISEMEQFMLYTLTKSRKKDFVELKEHGDTSYKLREYMRLFRDLVYEGKNVVFNAWDRAITYKNSGGEVITRLYPKLYEKLTVELCGLVDVVGYIDFYEKTGDRYLRFEPTKSIEAKCQLRGLGKFEPSVELDADGKVVPGTGFPMILEKLTSWNYGEDNEGNKIKNVTGPRKEKSHGKSKDNIHGKQSND